MVIVATGDKSEAVGKPAGVTELLYTIHAKMDFIVLQNVPFDIVIGSPNLKKLDAVIDFPV